jgi:hypothetical protein
MKLEYLTGINEYNDSLIRLFDFDTIQASKLKQEILQSIVNDKLELNLSKLDFVEPINCNLTFRISGNNSGISAKDYNNFNCDLTIEKYEEMMLIMEPFTKEINESFNWLYDIDTQIELLFSPNGNW